MFLGQSSKIFSAFHLGYNMSRGRGFCKLGRVQVFSNRGFGLSCQVYELLCFRFSVWSCRAKLQPAPFMRQAVLRYELDESIALSLDRIFSRAISEQYRAPWARVDVGCPVRETKNTNRGRYGGVGF